MGDTSFKGTIQKKIRYFLIYRCTCNYCSVTYYGKTCCHFFKRLVEHICVSNLTEKRVKTGKLLAFSDHCFECHCFIDFSNFDIIAPDTSKFNHLSKRVS